VGPYCASRWWLSRRQGRRSRPLGAKLLASRPIRDNISRHDRKRGSAIRCSAIRPNGFARTCGLAYELSPTTFATPDARADFRELHGDTTWRLTGSVEFFVDAPDARIVFAFAGRRSARWPIGGVIHALDALRDEHALSIRQALGISKASATSTVRSPDTGDRHAKGKNAIVRVASGIGAASPNCLRRARGANVVLNGFGEALQIEKTRSELTQAHQRQDRLFAAT